MRKLLVAAALLVAQVGGAQSDSTEIITSDTTYTIYEDGSSAVPDVEVEEAPVNYLSPPQESDKGPVALRPLHRPSFDSLRASDEFWYWNHKSGAEKEKAQGPGWFERFLGSPFARLLFWMVIGIGCCGLVYLVLLSLNINPFRRGNRAEEEHIDGAPTEPDFFSRDYETETAKALAAGDYRLAIRLRYLQLLRELASRNIIQYRQERSNGAYISQLLGTPYYKEFFRITRTFEYAWYGVMPVGKAAYDYVQTDIDHLKRRFA